MTSLGWWTWRSIFPEGGHHFPLAMPGTALWSLDSSLEQRQFCTCYLDMGWYGFVSKLDIPNIETWCSTIFRMGVIFFISPTWFGWFSTTWTVHLFGPTRSPEPWPHPTLFHSGVHSMYPLVNIQKTMENGHRNSEFSHEKWWLSIVLWTFTRGYHIWFVDGGCSSMVIIYKLWVIML